MISFYFEDNEYKFPNQWEELTQDQYLALLPLLQQYSSGILSVSDVKALWLVDIGGLTGMKIDRKRKDLFSENIYRMSREFNFVFEIEYPKGSLDNISTELRRKLKNTQPEELEQTPEVRYLSRLDYDYKIAACWCKNLVPEIEVKGQKLKGYSIKLNGKMFNTSLRSSQFNLATELLQQFEESKDVQYLKILTACLYLPADETFSGEKINERAESLLKDIDENILFAVLLNFQAFLAFIKTKTKWGLLWKRSPGKGGGLNVGADESLYNLSQKGYGDFEKVDRMPLTKFLDLMLKDLYDAVKEMHRYEMDITEIADKAGLSINQVKQIIS